MQHEVPLEMGTICDLLNNSGGGDQFAVIVALLAARLLAQGPTAALRVFDESFLLLEKRGMSLPYRKVMN